MKRKGFYMYISSLEGDTKWRQRDGKDNRGGDETYSWLALLNCSLFYALLIFSINYFKQKKQTVHRKMKK
jgi:hypothetical protein